MLARLHATALALALVLVAGCSANPTLQRPQVVQRNPIRYEQRPLQAQQPLQQQQQQQVQLVHVQQKY